MCEDCIHNKYTEDGPFDGRSSDQYIQTCVKCGAKREMRIQIGEWEDG